MTMMFDAACAVVPCIPINHNMATDNTGQLSFARLNDTYALKATMYNMHYSL